MEFITGMFLGAGLMWYGALAWKAHCEWCLKEAKEINDEAGRYLEDAKAIQNMIVTTSHSQR